MSATSPPTAEAAPDSVATDPGVARSRRLPRQLRGRELYWPLIALVFAGVLLRLYVTVVYSSLVTDYYTGDAARFLRIGYEGFFYDEWQPAGYPAFLSTVRAITEDMDVTTAAQHLLGLATGILLYATARRAQVPRPWALVPAGFVLLSGDHLFIEHAVLTESLWMFTFAWAFYAAARALEPASHRWLLAASALLGISVVVRNVSLVLPVVLTAWAVVCFVGPWRQRLRTAAAALLPAAGVVVLYVIAATSIGPYSGLGEMSGWSLYGRVGQFADCRQFTPPARTAKLCELRPTGERPGPFYYYFGGPGIPARKAFPALSVADGKYAGDFAKAAIIAQPIDYLRTVGKDVLRYFDATAGFDRTYAGSDIAAMSFRRAPSDAAYADAYIANVETKYSPLDGRPNAGTGLLETYQRVFRLDGLFLFVLIGFSFVALLRARGPARRMSALFLSTALVLLVLPPMLSSYDARYAIPPAMLLAFSATIGAAALARGRRRPLI